MKIIEMGLLEFSRVQNKKLTRVSMVTKRCNSGCPVREQEAGE
jgi:metal-sulfur cluster biosynthetic enzyme